MVSKRFLENEIFKRNAGQDDGDVLIGSLFEKGLKLKLEDKKAKNKKMTILFQGVQSVDNNHG